MLKRCLALTTCIAVATAGCGGRRWPTTAVSAADPALAAAPPLTVDVLPLDIAVWAEPGTNASPDAVRGDLEARVLNTALAALSQRAYGIDAVIDWSGNAGTVPVLGRDELRATIDALAGYGTDAAATPPALPVRLGEATGADATLYVGGWAYVARKRESTAAKVGKGVAIALAAVAVVLVVAMIAEGLSSSKSSKSKSKSKANGGAAVRDDREDAIASVRDHRTGSTSNVRDHRASRSASIVRDHRSGTGPVVRDHRGAATPRVRDHRGASGARIRDHGGGGVDVVVSEVIEASTAPAPAPPQASQSQLYLEMTLVDNRTGRVLWHAHQTFPANPARPADAERAARVLLASLPAH